MRKILALIDLVNAWIAKASSVLILGVAFVIVYEIIMRDVVKSPTVWVSEATVFGCGLAYLLGGAWNILTDHHVRVDILYIRLSPRGRAMIDCLTYFFFALYITVMIWATYNYAIQSVELRETTMSPWNPPIYPFKVAMLAALVMVFLQGTAKFIRDLYFIAKGEAL